MKEHELQLYIISKAKNQKKKWEKNSLLHTKVSLAAVNETFPKLRFFILYNCAMYVPKYKIKFQSALHYVFPFAIHIFSPWWCSLGHYSLVYYVVIFYSKKYLSKEFSWVKDQAKRRWILENNENIVLQHCLKEN